MRPFASAHAVLPLLLAALSAQAACAPGVRGQAGVAVGLASRAPLQVVIEPGETIWRIAHRFGISVDDLARANDLDDPTKVRAGTVLTVPGHVEGGDSARQEPSSRPAIDSTPATVATAAPTSKHAPEPAAEAEVEPPPAHPAAAMASPRPETPATPRTPTPGYALQWPLDGRIVARFGPRGGAPHDGIDIVTRAGTPVRAAAAGKVIYAGRNGGYGNLVILRHDHGLLTVYARNAVNLVRRGQHVAAGQVVGRVAETSGNTGQLHFEVREGVEARNPLKFLPP